MYHLRKMSIHMEAGKGRRRGEDKKERASAPEDIRQFTVEGPSFGDGGKKEE